MAGGEFCKRTLTQGPRQSKSSGERGIRGVRFKVREGGGGQQGRAKLLAAN